MTEGTSEVLPFAIGVAIVPIPVVAVIAMLFSSHARVNGPLFLIGWVAGLVVAFVAVLVLAGAGDISTDDTAADSVSWLKIILGVGLVGFASRSWRKRPAAGEEPKLPGWMAGVDALTGLKALGLGAVLAALNPKNLILIVGAATGVAGIDLERSDVAVATAVFVIVASLSVASPIAYYFVGGARARSSLEDLRGWLILHNDAVLSMLFLVFGVVLISKGLAPLG